MNCPTDKTWYVEARVGSENHRGECVRYIDDRRGTDGGYENRPAEKVIAELKATLAARDAELATLRDRMETAERERDHLMLAPNNRLDGYREMGRQTAAALNARDAALSEVARLTRERDEAREWAHSFAERAAKERDEALIQHALESGRRVAAEAERDEATERAVVETLRAVNAAIAGQEFNFDNPRLGLHELNNRLRSIDAGAIVRALAAKGGA